MTRPVIAADGHTYEEEATQTWLHQHSISMLLAKLLSTSTWFQT